MRQLFLTIIIASLFVGPCLAEEEHAATPAPVPAPALTNEVDQISYTLGNQIGSDFKRQQVTLDESALHKGVEDGQKGEKPLLEVHEMNDMLGELKKRISDEMKQKAKEQMEKRQQEAQALLQDGEAYRKAYAEKEGVKVLDSGLMYRVLKQGDGSVSPGKNDIVTLHNHATFTDGFVFSDTYEKNTPTTVPVKAALPGIAEALEKMHEGDKWEVVLPPNLLTGKTGSLANRTITVELELIKIAEPATEPQSAPEPAAASPEEAPGEEKK